MSMSFSLLILSGGAAPPVWDALRGLLGGRKDRQEASSTSSNTVYCLRQCLMDFSPL